MGSEMCIRDRTPAADSNASWENPIARTISHSVRTGGSETVAYDRLQLPLRGFFLALREVASPVFLSSDFFDGKDIDQRLDMLRNWEILGCKPNYLIP